MAEPETPLDAEGYLRILQNVTPPDYYDPLLSGENPGAGRIYQAMARTQAKCADHVYREIEARYFRTHSTSEAEPASTWKYARAQVRIKRMSMLNDPRYVAARQGGTQGAMILRGPGGRLYTNEHDVRWVANDPEPEKSITFRCMVPGTVGNLGFYADDGGLITLEADAGPNKEPDLSIIDHQNLSDQRSSQNASILPPVGLAPSVIRDSGIPDQFTSTHKDLYVEIIDSAHSENVGRFLRILDVNVSQVELPPNSGLFPHSISVDDAPTLEPILSAKLDDGGVFTDYTTQANDDTSDDVVLAPAVPVVNDAFYFGYQKPFVGIAIAVTTAATGNWSVVWEYWNGAWVQVPGLIDATQSFHVVGQSRAITPTVPAGWLVTTVDGVDAYWFRARVAVVNTTGIQPLAAKIRNMVSVRLIPENGTLSWAVRDWKEMGFKLTRVEAFAGGRDNELGALAEERGVAISDGESDESLRRRVQQLADVVTPAAIRRAVNRQLAPFNLRGYAWDVSNGLTGFFADLDFGDYYQAGDLFPVDKQKLIDSDNFSYGWFIVFAPYLADGEFGGFCDEGPVVWLEPVQQFLASAADMCFLDGYPTNANGVYQAIWEQVNAIRAFGVGFSIILSKTANAPPC